MAGYEGADHINSRGLPLDMNAQNQHRQQAQADYRLLQGFGIRTVRESMGWRLIERAGKFDFSSLDSRLEAAQATGMQIVWTLCHYGWPSDVDAFSDSFIARFAAFCARAADYLAAWPSAESSGLRLINPINEISFLSWAVCESDQMHPHCGGHPELSFSVKKRLVQASIAGCDALWAVLPDTRILNVDPVIHIAPPPQQPEHAQAAQEQRGFQFQAWDMLAGRCHPELGGGARYLDVLGLNYYHGNQWEHPSQERLHWHLGDPRRRPLRSLLAEVQARYGHPMLLAETSHVGAGRGHWIADVAEEVTAAQVSGTPLLGVCLYPIIDRPDWENPGHWHRSGLWDVHANDGTLPRQLDPSYATQLLVAQVKLGYEATNTIACSNRSQPSITRNSAMPSLVVLSHLRWNFVFQRPQHLLSRFAQHERVLFIEEPVWDAGPPWVEISDPLPNLRVLTPHTSIPAPGFHADQMPVLEALLRSAIAAEKLGAYCAWLYTPMALPLLRILHPAALIYDCMDELSAFNNAPVLLQERERALMQQADVVFTGGPSLYAAKRAQNPNVHCFPSAVDAAHFAKGSVHANANPAVLAIAGPRLGFFGVVDERFDCDLLAALAQARPQWQFFIVGPVVKIDPAILPKHSNIHYFGQQAYAELPSFLAGWDVCLMPFALNAATRFISPTKTLEYMAAELPVVSTAVADVVSLYGDLVHIAHSSAEFISACEAALNETPAASAERRSQMRQRVASVSWDATAAAMMKLVAQAVGKRRDEASKVSATHTLASTQELAGVGK